MKVCNLASGSKGNCTYIKTDKYNLLFDAGKNVTYIDTELKSIGCSVVEIDYVFITHTHSDHISALKPVLKKSGATLVCSEAIFNELEDLKEYNHVVFLENDMELDDGTLIRSFRSSHDANDARNFVISNNESSVAYITDTGYVNRNNFKMLENLSLYLFESNHDIEMLENGPYPVWLKKRVLSDNGHLSNNAAGFYLSKLIGDNTKHVLLIHLSETNNCPEKALETVNDTLKKYEIEFGNISCAKQDEHTEVFEI